MCVCIGESCCILILKSRSLAGISSVRRLLLFGVILVYSACLVAPEEDDHWHGEGEWENCQQEAQSTANYWGGNMVISYF